MKRSSHTFPVTSESAVESIISSKQLQEPKSLLFSFFNLRACTYEEGMKVKRDEGGRAEWVRETGWYNASL